MQVAYLKVLVVLLKVVRALRVTNTFQIHGNLELNSTFECVIWLKRLRIHLDVIQLALTPTFRQCSGPCVFRPMRTCTCAAFHA
jgi:hypothetical protein